MTKVAKYVIVLVTALSASAASAQWYQGPTGGSGGSPFDFWVESGNARNVGGMIIRMDNDNRLRCIGIHYRDNPPGTAYRHGSHCGDEEPFDTQPRGFSLDPGEVIIGIDGTYGEFINSIRFFTNRKQTDVFGTRAGRRFGYTAPAGHKIVAFTGRAGRRIDAIGVMYVPIPDLPRSATEVPQGQR